MTNPQTPALRIVEADAISPAPIGPARPPLELVPSREQQERIADAIRARRSPATQRAYATQWRLFERYAGEQQADALPAAPLTVAAYLSDRAAAGASLSTITKAAASIAAQHRERDLPDPTSDERVRAVRKGLSRQLKQRAPKQAAPIDRDAFLQIIEQAARPRPLSGRGRTLDGRQVSESADRAERRAAVDIALIATMRDALLRSSEAAALRWADIETDADGSGSVYIARSKTDQQSEGATLYLRRPTMRYLSAIRPEDADPAAPVFGLSARQISRRIAAAAQAANLDAGLNADLTPKTYSGHSCRVGQAGDLARVGASLVEIQQDGRWSSPTMPARYAAASLRKQNSAIARRMPAED